MLLREVEASTGVLSQLVNALKQYREQRLEKVEQTFLSAHIHQTATSESCVRARRPINHNHDQKHKIPMDNSQIQLDGDPRKLAKALYRAARESYREKHGHLSGWDDMRASLEAEIPALAREMAEALDDRARDVYLINALEVMALSYARSTLKKASDRPER